MKSIPKKLAMINDIAGFGRCSTTVALPIISAMGIQVCPVPTSVFSNHTGFPSFQFLDLTLNMSPYLEQWEQMGLTFDGVYCGFLGSVAQIDIVRSFIRAQWERGSLIIIDPVMGDNGLAYSTITPDHCISMRGLLEYADVITPNITEACLLTGIPYRESGWTGEALASAALSLAALGPKRTVITGIREGDDFINCIYEQGGSPAMYRVPAAGRSRPGTGDVFASIIAADALNGVPFAASVQKAAGFVRLCTEEADALGVPPEEGVCFENHLGFFPSV